MIFQDFLLFPNVSVGENIAFSAELGGHRRLYNRIRMRALAAETPARAGVQIDLEAEVETLPVAHKQLVAICRALTGHDVADAPPAPLLLAVRALAKAGSFAGVNFDLHDGNVLRISGPLGSGRTSLAKALFGLVAPDAGSVQVDGRSVRLGDPLAAAQADIG